MNNWRPNTTFAIVIASATLLACLLGASAFKFTEKVEASIVLGNLTVNITSVQKRAFLAFLLLPTPFPPRFLYRIEPLYALILFSAIFPMRSRPSEADGRCHARS